jgi:hypothetical protein
MVATYLKFFSVQSLCSLCLCGGFFGATSNHRDTESTEIAQRRPKLGHYPKDAGSTDAPKPSLAIAMLIHVLAINVQEGGDHAR